MRQRRIHSFFLLVVFVLLFPALGLAEDAVLTPGYISGTFNISGYDINSYSVSAYGNGYSSSRSGSAGAYSLTVQGGDWDYNVYASASVRTGASYYPYTNISFGYRTLRVPVGQTIVNDYAFTPGAIRLKLNITGAQYNDWYAYVYAYNYASAGQEQTNSNSYTSKYYSPGGQWETIVRPNAQIRVYAYVYIDGKAYPVWTDILKYVDVAAGEVVDLEINVNHTLNEYSSVSGVIGLENVENLNYHYVYGGGAGSYVYSNPGSYVLSNVLSGNQYFRAISYMDNYRAYLQWPCENGNCSNSYIQVEPGTNHTKDFTGSAGVLTGKITFTGTLTNKDFSSYSLTAQGTGSIYVPGQGWVTTPTNGGYGQSTVYGSDQDPVYRLYLTAGPWQPYRLYGYRYSYDGGYYSYNSLNIYDYNYYYDGSYYNFGQHAEIVSGQTLVQDRQYCLGSLSVRFRTSDGSLLSYPQVYGYSSVFDGNGKQVMYVNNSGYAGVYNTESPVVEVHGPAGAYTFNCRANTQDGSYVTFAKIPANLECGVRKGVDLSGPAITVSSPAAGLLTNALSISVQGTAADDAGVAGVNVNGSAAAITPTGNPGEVAFSYGLALTSGKNTVTVVAVDEAGNMSSDERDIYADHWSPAVDIVSPVPDSFVSMNGTMTLEVSGSDRGYGFGLKVLLDGVLVYEAEGSANETTAEAVSYSGAIGPLAAGDHTIEAVVTDKAGNSASASVKVTSYMAADVIVKPEARHNKEEGTSTIFVRLPDTLTSTASLSASENREITAIPAQHPVDVKYSAEEDKLILKFARTPELMSDQYYTVEGRYCPAPGQCYYWRGSDTTLW